MACCWLVLSAFGVFDVKSFETPCPKVQERVGQESVQGRCFALRQIAVQAGAREWRRKEPAENLPEAPTAWTTSPDHVTGRPSRELLCQRRVHPKQQTKLHLCVGPTSFAALQSPSRTRPPQTRLFSKCASEKSIRCAKRLFHCNSTHQEPSPLTIRNDHGFAAICNIAVGDVAAEPIPSTITKQKAIVDSRC